MDINKVKNIVPHIEYLILTNKSYSEIMCEMDAYYGDNYVSLRRYFKQIYGIPIRKYIFRRLMTVIYQQSDQVDVTARTKIRGVKYIPEKFTNEFNLDFYEHCLSEEQMQPCIPYEVDFLHFRIPVIRNAEQYFLISEQKDKRSKEKSIRYLLKLPTYMIPPNNNINAIEEVEKRSAIAYTHTLNLLHPYYPFKPVKPIPQKMLDEAMENASLYDWDNPRQAEHKFVTYAPHIPEEMENTLREMIPELVGNMHCPLPDALLSNDMYEPIRTILWAQDIDEITYKLNLNTEKVIEMIHQCLCEGTLRVF